jgi:hypothetical protein
MAAAYVCWEWFGETGVEIRLVASTWSNVFSTAGLRT